MDYPTTFVSDEEEGEDLVLSHVDDEHDMEDLRNNNKTRVIEPFVRYNDGEGIYTFDDDDELDIDDKQYEDNMYKVEIRNDNSNNSRKPQLLYSSESVTYTDENEDDEVLDEDLVALLSGVERDLDESHNEVSKKGVKKLLSSVFNLF